MLVAIDESGNRYLSVDPTTLHQDRFYLCQECKRHVFLRLCLNKVSHFAHYPDSKKCEGAWEPDTEAHSTMKQDVYDYFKKFSWVQKIEFEYPLDIEASKDAGISNDIEMPKGAQGKIYIPDIYIETINGHRIAVECQAHRCTKDSLLRRTLAYVNSGIYPLFVLDSREFLGEFVIPRDDLYVSPRFDEKDGFIKRFYIYNTNGEEIQKYGGIISSLDVLFAKIPSWAPVGTYADTYQMKTDFSSYKINMTKAKYRIGDDTVEDQLSMVVDMEVPKFNFTKIHELKHEEEFKEVLRQRLASEKRDTIIMEEELKRKKEDNANRKREADIRKKQEMFNKLLEDKLKSIDVDEPWGLYKDIPGSGPVLLPPLSWKGGSQVSNLKVMLEFFKKFYIPDKTKIMIYKSCCGSGKSGTLLHVIRGMGRGIIVTPFKALQRQYNDDYFTGDKFVMKKDGTRLKVAVLLGRNNFDCKWLTEKYDYQQMLIEESKKPENVGMYIDINDEILNMYKRDKSCANKRLPCTRPLQFIRSGQREPRWMTASTCLHPDTDILTPDGIKKIKDIKIGDRVYSVNIKDNEMITEIDTVINKKRNVTDKLIRFYNLRSGCDIKVTEDHIMIFKRGFRSIAIHHDTASDLISEGINDDVVFIKPFYLPHNDSHVSNITIGNRSFDMNDFLTLLGWYISEGYYKELTDSYNLTIEKSTIKVNFGYCNISQSVGVHDEYLDGIIHLLDRMQLKYDTYCDSDGTCSISIYDSDIANSLVYFGGNGPKNKFIHKDIFKLPKGQLSHLFESLMKGDGEQRDNKNNISYNYGSQSNRLVNDITFLANILGYRTSKTVKDDQNYVYIVGTDNIYTGYLKIDMLRYNGDVYDIEVGKNHNYFAGEDGKFVLVHNCPYWIPTPMSKAMIDKWASTIVSGEKIDTDLDEGINTSEINKNIPIVGKAKTRLDTIKERIKCSNIEYYNSVAMGQVGVFIRDEFDEDGKHYPDVCEYYKQFYHYARDDVIVMNSAKWHLETMIGRKPLTSIEIFDEGDSWLDNIAKEIEFPRSLIDRIIPPDNKMKGMKSDTLSMFDMSLQDIKKRVTSEDNKIGITDVKSYKDLFLSVTNILVELKKNTEDDEKLEEKIVDAATVLRYLDKASISYVQGNREEIKVIKVFIPYPDNILRELFNLSSKNIIITSGTMHNNTVLSNLFGINADNYIAELLQGRKENPGRLKCIKARDDSEHALVRVNHNVWQSPQFQAYYYRSLNYILDRLKIEIDKITGRPGEGKIIALTPARKYAEGIKNRNDVYIDFAKRNDDDDMSIKINTKISDYVDNTLEDIRKVKPCDINIDGNVLRTDKQIIVSTRMVRGSDLHDDLCRAVVMLKWPYPDISSGYNQALEKRYGSTVFKKIMQDKAEREAVQYVSRGLRHDLDWELFATPDENAFNQVFRLFSYD